MPKPCLCLDLDGPLLDVRARYHGVYAGIAAELGVAPLAPAEYWQAKRARSPLEAFFPGDEDADRLRAYYLERWLARIESPEWLARDVPVEGAAACLAVLAESHALHLLTLRRERAALADQLAALDLRRHFETVCSGWVEGSGGARLKASWLRPLLAGGIRAMVGDSETDVGAARMVNVRAIGVSFGIRTAADLQTLGAERVIDRLDELPTLLAAAAAQGG